MVGEATRFLMEQVLDEPSRNTPETLRELLTGWRQARGA
jgi:tRNA nucleotidyltransferase (CCA-adding enzyme)